MYSFEGNYRRKPQQNLAGSSRQLEKNELLLRAHLERQKRQNDRKRVESAIKIQAAARGFLTRRRLKRIRREQFDVKIVQLRGRRLVDADDVFQVLNRVPYICEPTLDVKRVVVANVIVRSNVRAIVDSLKTGRHTLHPLRTLLHYNLKAIAESREDNESIVSCVETVDNFIRVDRLVATSGCDVDSSKTIVEGIFSYLVQKSFFRIVLKLIGETDNSIRRTFGLSSVSRSLSTIVASTNRVQRVVWLSAFCSVVATTNDVFVPLKNHVVSDIRWKEVNFEDLIDALIQLPTSSHNLTTLYFVLSVDGGQVEAHCRRANDYFALIFNLTSYLIEAICEEVKLSESRDEDEDVDMIDDVVDPLRSSMIDECKKSIFKSSRADDWSRILDNILQGADVAGLRSFTACLLNIWLCSDKSHQQLTLCIHLTYNKQYVRALWQLITSLKRESPFSEPISLISVLSRGLPLTVDETKELIPLLTMFSYLLNSNLSTLTDEEFHSDDDPSSDPKPFKMNEMIAVSKTMKNLAVGIIVVAFPDLHTHRHDQCLYCNVPTNNKNYNYLFWNKLHDEVVSLVVHLRDRDLRFPFTKEGHWYSSYMSNVSNTVPVYKGLHSAPVKFFRCAVFDDGQNDKTTSKTLQTTHECRVLRLLSSIPFIVPFIKRVEILQNSTDMLKIAFQNPDAAVLTIPNTHHRIRRNYIYEDAFDKFANFPDLKRTVRIQLVNAAGLEEAGVDGGGVSREFLAEFMKTAFDPNRGFFVSNNNNELYPNPNVGVICPDYEVHYDFIGRMLGKAVYENILVDVPLAEFFLAKLAGKSSDQCLNSLTSIDPDLYRNITKLRQYKGDFAELGLDFTLSTNEYGKRKVVQLKENGSEIAVTRDNVNEYISLVAGYKLHVEVEKQSKSFIEGLNSVIPIEWLEMFTSKELQVLISGKDILIDVEDLKINTVYTGGYAIDDPTIVAFWNVVASFSDSERSDLIKFVTSHSRPPLLGFKELHPKFCIQKASGHDRLPTASTCMNLLKLSTFQSEEVLREKLLYAIQAGTGFELS